MPGSAVTHTNKPAPSSPDAVRRRLPIGAEPMGDGRSHFRVWAPAAQRVDVIVADRPAGPLNAEANGYFSGIADAAVGSRYRFAIDNGESGFPDPASRFQPDEPHGPSPI